ncbi:MAG: DUF192 domain-containing protein [Leptolyngbyaceae bacterium]|nr:DUF192 domain-containing protein [Leptolyngbyaceae bacterium]
MLYSTRFLQVSLSILLLACAPSVMTAPPVALSVSEQNPEPQPSLPNKPVQPALGQTLPISAQVVIANQTIQLEVAQTIPQQATGLMYRTALADDRGMLFPFNPPQNVSFWMKNVYISLDMVFLSKGKVKAIAANVPPCPTEPCPLYSPGTPIDQVIELRGGRAAELGIKVGDTIKVQPLNSSRGI